MSVPVIWLSAPTTYAMTETAIRSNLIELYTNFVRQP
jgi:hypothetical protein